jgi:hypothetical protein
MELRERRPLIIAFCLRGNSPGSAILMWLARRFHRQWSTRFAKNTTINCATRKFNLLPRLIILVGK